MTKYLPDSYLIERIKPITACNGVTYRYKLTCRFRGDSTERKFDCLESALEAAQTEIFQEYTWEETTDNGRFSCD